MNKVIRFTSKTCQPCKVLAPIFEDLSKQFSSNAVFQTIDIDENKEMAIKYNVSAVPTIVIEKNGKEVQRHIAVKPKATYISNLSAIL